MIRTKSFLNLLSTCIFRSLFILALGSVWGSSVTPAAAQQMTKDVRYPAGSFPIDFQGRKIKLSWDAGTIRAYTAPGAPIDLDLYVSMDLRALQNTVVAEINRQGLHEDCGNRLTVSGTRLVPAGNNSDAILSSNLNYQRWECAKTKIPETVCHDTWIKLPLGGKTKGVPKCSVRWNLKTAKTKLISQSGNVAMNLTPQIQGNRIGVNTRVTHANLRGFAGKVVSAFGWSGKLRDMAQREAEKALQRHPLSFGLPPDAQIIDLKLKSVAFADRGNGVLGGRVSADAKITLKTFMTLLRRAGVKVN